MTRTRRVRRVRANRPPTASQLLQESRRYGAHEEPGLAVVAVGAQRGGQEVLVVQHADHDRELLCLDRHLVYTSDLEGLAGAADLTDDVRKLHSDGVDVDGLGLP